MRMRDCFKQRKGITLLELLAVIAIVGLVFTVAYRVVSESMDFWRGRRARFEAWHTGRQTLRRATRELRSTFPILSDTRLTFEEQERKSKLLFEGREDGIRFVSIVGSQALRTSGEPGLREIEYSLVQPVDGGKGGLRRRVKTVEGRLISNSLEEEVVGLHMRYWHSEGGWVVTWLDRKNIPQAVEITIEVREGRDRTRSFSATVHLPVTQTKPYP